MTSVPWIIGMRYSSGKAGSLYLSFISRVSLFGMLLGVVALTVVVSVMNGFDRELKRRILGAVPHIVVKAERDAHIDEWLAGDDRVAGFAPFLRRSGVLIHGGGNHLVSVYGIEPDLESRVSIIPGHLVDGRLSRLEPGTNKAFMGRSLAYQLGVRQGDLMTLIIPEPSAGGNSVTPRMARVEVAGFFEVDSEVDYSLMLMNREDLAAIAHDASLTLRVTVNNIFLAPAVAEDIRALGERVLSVDVWTEDYGDFFETVRMEKIMMFILLTLIVAIAAFNIVSGLSMMVKEKQADIAVLRTLGLAPSRVMQVFVIQGTLVGVLGTIGGMLIGVPLAVYIPEVIGFFEDLAGARMLAGTYFDRVPSDVRPADLVVIVVVSLGLSLAATLYPAWRAAQLHPADVLRYE